MKIRELLFAILLVISLLIVFFGCWAHLDEAINQGNLTPFFMMDND